MKLQEQIDLTWKVIALKENEGLNWREIDENLHTNTGHAYRLYKTATQAMLLSPCGRLYVGLSQRTVNTIDGAGLDSRDKILHQVQTRGILRYRNTGLAVLQELSEWLALPRKSGSCCKCCGQPWPRSTERTRQAKL